MRKISSALFLALIAVFATITPSYALLPYETIQITYNNYWDYHPYINNNGYIVWDANDGSGYKIFQYDGSDITALPDSGGGSDPQINNNGDVVWHDAVYTVYLYNGSTTATIGNGYMPDINDNGYVAWLNSPSGGGIYIYNGSTTTQIGSGVGNSFPHINNMGHVVWSTSSGQFLYDGSATTQIGSGGEHPDINDNGDIVWGGGAGIFHYNGTTTTQIADSGYYPHINNNGYIVWDNDSDVFLYDGSITTQLTNNSFRNIRPVINDGGDVAWYGYDGSDFEIFLARPVPEPSSILLLSLGLLGTAVLGKRRF